MPVFIPILIGVAVIAAASKGVYEGKKGLDLLAEAKRIANAAKARHDRQVRALEKKKEEVNGHAEKYGRRQAAVIGTTILRMVKFLKRHKMRVSDRERKILEGLGLTFTKVGDEWSINLESSALIGGAFRSLTAASAAYFGMSGVASTIGVASTGSALSGLTGAAGSSATLAWFGGGSLAAGGGGMAVGSVILGGVAVGPALLIGGLVLSSQGEKSLTSARKYERDCDKRTADLDQLSQFLDEVRLQIDEARSVLNAMNRRALQALRDLESIKRFDRKRHASQFRQAMILTLAVAEILRSPILDEKGELHVKSLKIFEKHKKFNVAA